MKKRIFILLCFISIGINQICYAQNQNKIDSLLNVLKRAKEDTSKVNTLIALGWELSNSNPDTSIILANQALSLSEKATSKKHIANSYHVIAWADFVKGNYPSSLENNLKALSLREELDDKSGIAKSLNQIGNVYIRQGDYPKALDHYFKALKMDEELGNKNGIANELGNIGLVYNEQGNYPKALDYYFKSLKMQEELGNKNGIAGALGNIGIVYHKQKDYPKALDYYFKALKMQEELGNKNGIAIHLSNIGLVYYDQGVSASAKGNMSFALADSYPKALDYYFKALKMAEQLGNKNLIGVHLGNIGSVYSEQGDNPKALDYYFKALKLGEQLGNKNLIAAHLGNIGFVYTETGKFVEAEEYLKKAIAINDSIGALDYLNQFEEFLSQLYDTTGRYKLALEHYKKAMVLKDTLFNQEKNKEITRKEMNYGFEKKEEATKAEQDKKDAIAQQQIQKQKILKYSLIGGLALLALLSVFVFNNFRVRNKLKLQTLRNKIASDLHDEVGSTLSSIALFSDVAMQQSKEVIPMLQSIGDNSRKMLESMADIVWTINPANDNFEKIILRMRSFAFELLGAKKIDFDFKVDETVSQMKISMESRKNLYLIFKEAINNLMKYSEADRASFSITGNKNNLTMLIRDNGKGFDVSKETPGNGLKNMKKRALEIGAQFLVESETGNGTTIQLILKVA